jgi:dihydroxy-acid dehydratase
MAGGRGLWRATGMTDGDWNMPIIAVDMRDIPRIKALEVRGFEHSAPGGRRAAQAFSKRRRFKTFCSDGGRGMIRSKAHAFTQHEGMAVMSGIPTRYEASRSGPGMQDMLCPTSYLKSKGLENASAWVTDGRFSDAVWGLLIEHVSPEANEGGLIEIANPERRIAQKLDDATLTARRAYAALTTSAAMGAVRKLPEGM